MRAFLSIIIPFLLPFLAYYFWLLFENKEKNAQKTTPWLRLFWLGIACVIMVLLYGVITSAQQHAPQKKYVPAHMENGKLVGEKFE
ncbi:MAG: DUF6111 family protein [Alphaproteobacteria bacterium]